MSEWDKVTNLKNIEITVDGGQSSSIFGNGRNCCALILSFNAVDANDTCIDIRKIDMGSYTQLINYETGTDLPHELPEGAEGLFYYRSQGKFRNPSPSTDATTTPTKPDHEKRARIIYYVYGRFKEATKQAIAATITLPTGKLFSSAKHGDDPNKVDLDIKQPIVYKVSDLEPLEWVEVFKDKFEAMEWVSFIKLKPECESKIVDYEYNWPTYDREDLLYLKSHNGKSEEYIFYLCPLGKPNTFKFNCKFMNVIDIELDVKYNQEPNALCLVRLKAPHTYYLSGYGPMDYIDTFKFYDTHGNLGEFKVEFGEDPLNPVIVPPPTEDE